MIKIITATYATSETLDNIFDDLINIGLPSEKIFTNEPYLQVKIIYGSDIESEILELVNSHNPSATESHEFKEDDMAKVITATYDAVDTVKNVVDDLVNNVGLPAEEVFADKKNLQVKVLSSSAIEAEIDEILNRHNPIALK